MRISVRKCHKFKFLTANITNSNYLIANVTNSNSTANVEILNYRFQITGGKYNNRKILTASETAPKNFLVRKPFSYAGWCQADRFRIYPTYGLWSLRNKFCTMG